MKRKLILFFIMFSVVKVWSEENIKTNQFYFAGKENQEIYAIDDGIVIDNGYDIEKGTYIEIDYKYLKMTVLYCNLSSFTYFDKNEVPKGSKIGRIGRSGYTLDFGSHIIISLHEDFLFYPDIDEK